MKGLLIIIAVFIALGVPAQFENLEEADANAKQTCIEKSGINPAEVKNKKLYELNPGAANMKEYLECFLKEMDFVDENGNYRMSLVVEYKHEVEGLDYQLIDIVTKECLTADVIESLECYSLIVFLDKSKQKCITQTNIPSEIAEDEEKCIIVETSQLKEYLACRALDMEMMSPKGEILEPGLRGYLEQALKIRDHDKVDNIITKCSDAKATPEETAFELRKCICSEYP